MRHYADEPITQAAIYERDADRYRAAGQLRVASLLLHAARCLTSDYDATPLFYSQQEPELPY